MSLWFPKALRRARRTPARAGHPVCKLTVEHMEDRCVPSCTPIALTVFQSEDLGPCSPKFGDEPAVTLRVVPVDVVQAELLSSPSLTPDPDNSATDVPSAANEAALTIALAVQSTSVAEVPMGMLRVTPRAEVGMKAAPSMGGKTADSDLTPDKAAAKTVLAPPPDGNADPSGWLMTQNAADEVPSDKFVATSVLVPPESGNVPPAWREITGNAPSNTPPESENVSAASRALAGNSVS